MALANIKARITQEKILTTGRYCQTFMPKGSLSRFLNIENVTNALADPVFNIPFHKRNDTAVDIIEEGQSVFAILLEMNGERYLSSFIENHNLDSSLPIPSSVLSDIMPHNGALFERLQKDYYVHSFRKSQYRRTLPDTITLPFLSQESLKEGGYSSVYAVKVHPAHQNFFNQSESKAISLVRKELHSFEQKGHAEAELLFLLGSLRHPNIVELLSCYTQNGITNMLFPRADLDLHDLLLQKQRPRSFKHDHIFFDAMRGVASGLSYLHNFRPRADPSDPDPCGPMHGCHHDVKPKNILVYGATFVLADFGFSKMKSIGENTQTRWKDTTFEYGAPECRDAQSFVAGMVGRASDIWSIGCVFSEVAAYIEQSELGVQRFREGRTVDAEYGKQRCFHDGQALSSHVDHYLRDLGETAQSTSIESLIRLVRKTLSRLDRPKAEEVEMELLQCALISVLDGLLDIIKRVSTANVGSIDRNLFEIRLSLEKNRLIAWGDGLGIKPFDDREEAVDRQTAFLGSGFYATLKSAFDALTSTREFETLEDDNDFKLNVLRQANDDLCRHLAERTRFSIDQKFRMISISNLDTSLRRQIATLDITEETEKDASTIAAMKYMSILLERKILEPIKNCRIEKSLLEPDPNTGVEASLGPQTWSYSYGHRPNEKRKILVEYMPYWEKQIRDSESQEFHDAIEAMFERVQELAAMLRISPKPAEFRVLDCLGSFHDPTRQRFALVYALPFNNSRPIRLNKLMGHGTSYLAYPELGEKLALAKALVACIQSFHISGWIHKGLSSLNILFFLDGVADWKDIRFSEPFVVGFDHSRKDGKGHYTQGPVLLSGSQEYFHPEYRAGLKEAKKSYDYYSLGVILLEIGLWMSISNIYEQPRYRKYSPEALREEYINVCNRDLGKTMGSIYQSVTRTCLSYGSGTESFEDQFHFQAHVVDRLNTCRFDVDV